jgi:hypothetical protein
MVAFDAMATGVWAGGVVWQATELLLWRAPAAWFSVDAFCTGGGLWNWYVNFEHPTRRTEAGFDTFGLAVDLAIAPDLTRWEWKDEDEYAHVRRLGIVTDTEPRGVDAARDQVLAISPDTPACSRTWNGGRPRGGSRAGAAP